jgi:outer membrane protein W
MSQPPGPRGSRRLILFLAYERLVASGMETPRKFCEIFNSTVLSAWSAFFLVDRFGSRLHWIAMVSASGRVAVACHLFVIIADGSILSAQSRSFLGVMGGVATLSADARSEVSAVPSAVSLYKPENGPMIQVLGGRHLTDWVSLEGTYIWNANNLTLTSLTSGNGNTSSYEQHRDSSQQSASGDVLVYFRNRASRIRPYLAIGLSLIRFSSTERTLQATPFPPPVPAQKFTSTRPGVRFPVGIDISLWHGWAIRYSFAETIQANPISAQLSPPGQRHLAVYQNLFGFLKYF